MKQNITVEQLNELSQPARQKLRKYMLKEWAEPMRIEREKGKFEKVMAQIPTEDYLLDIGQLIEFLNDNRRDVPGWGYTEVFITTATFGKYPHKEWKVGLVLPTDKIGDGNFHIKSELCDSLWEAVKQILEDDK